MLSTTCPGSHNLAPRHRKLLMKQQSNASKCSTNASDIVLDSSPVHPFLRADSGNLLPQHSVLFDGRCRRRHIPFGHSALTRVSFRQNKIQSPKADYFMLAIRVKTTEVQRITTPLPLLLAFLVASHTTEAEGVVSMDIGLWRREDITMAVIAPPKRTILRKETVKTPRPP
ncbi:hypothetical protein V8C40DRAFT_19388 [Trichoderma camerunense]